MDSTLISNVKKVEFSLLIMDHMRIMESSRLLCVFVWITVTRWRGDHQEVKGADGYQQLNT